LGIDLEGEETQGREEEQETQKTEVELSY